MCSLICSCAKFFHISEKLPVWYECDLRKHTQIPTNQCGRRLPFPRISSPADVQRLTKKPRPSIVPCSHHYRCRFHTYRLQLSQATVSLSHVGRRLDRRNELEDDIADTDNANESSKDNVKGVVVKEDGAGENVDFQVLARAVGMIMGKDVHNPRPRNEKRKDAYRDT